MVLVFVLDFCSLILVTWFLILGSCYLFLLFFLSALLLLSTSIQYEMFLLCQFSGKYALRNNPVAPESDLSAFGRLYIHQDKPVHLIIPVLQFYFVLPEQLYHANFVLLIATILQFVHSIKC